MHDGFGRFSGISNHLSCICKAGTLFHRVNDSLAITCTAGGTIARQFCRIGSATELSCVRVTTKVTQPRRTSTGPLPATSDSDATSAGLFNVPELACAPLACALPDDQSQQVSANTKSTHLFGLGEYARTEDTATGSTPMHKECAAVAPIHSARRKTEITLQMN
eukprot:361005-Chlamydomonas_euryale.AAC.4